jgi:hypothetical protein
MEESLLQSDILLLVLVSLLPLVLLFQSAIPIQVLFLALLLLLVLQFQPDFPPLVLVLLLLLLLLLLSSEILLLQSNAELSTPPYGTQST